MNSLNRRTVLAATGLAALVGSAEAETGAPPATAGATGPSVQARLLTRARENSRALSFDGRHFGGPAWNFVLSETRGAEMVLLGEEHGTAEIPLFARELYLALGPAGFDTLAVEISPPIAEDLDQAARGGVSGVADFIRAFPPGPAFYFWKTEAELIAAVRAATPGRRAAVWGLDYEVTGDRRLIDRLEGQGARLGDTGAIGRGESFERRLGSLAGDAQSGGVVHVQRRPSTDQNPSRRVAPARHRCRSDTFDPGGDFSRSTVCGRAGVSDRTSAARASTAPTWSLASRPPRRRTTRPRCCSRWVRPI